MILYLYRIHSMVSSRSVMSAILYPIIPVFGVMNIIKGKGGLHWSVRVYFNHINPNILIIPSFSSLSIQKCIHVQNTFFVF